MAPSVRAQLASRLGYERSGDHTAVGWRKQIYLYQCLAHYKKHVFVCLPSTSFIKSGLYLCNLRNSTLFLRAFGLVKDIGARS
jgi:hypothetical protein